MLAIIDNHQQGPSTLEDVIADAVAHAIPNHFDLRIQIGERLIYFETLLFYYDPSDPDDPTINVVSIHDA